MCLALCLVCKGLKSPNYTLAPPAVPYYVSGSCFCDDIWIQQFNVKGNKQDIQPFLGEWYKKPVATHRSCWFNKHTWYIFSILTFPNQLLSVSSFSHSNSSRLKKWHIHRVLWQDHQDLQALVILPVFSPFETFNVELLGPSATVIYILEGLEFHRRFLHYAFFMRV